MSGQTPSEWKFPEVSVTEAELAGLVDRIRTPAPGHGAHAEPVDQHPNLDWSTATFAVRAGLSYGQPADGVVVRSHYGRHGRQGETIFPIYRDAKGDPEWISTVSADPARLNPTQITLLNALTAESRAASRGGFDTTLSSGRRPSPPTALQHHQPSAPVW